MRNPFRTAARLSREVEDRRLPSLPCRLLNDLRAGGGCRLQPKVSKLPKAKRTKTGPGPGATALTLSSGVSILSGCWETSSTLPYAVRHLLYCQTSREGRYRSPTIMQSARIHRYPQGYGLCGRIIQKFVRAFVARHRSAVDNGSASLHVRHGEFRQDNHA